MSSNELNSMDLNRMISAIENDCELELKKIRIEIQKEFEKVKESTFKRIKLDLINEFEQKLKEEEKEKIVLEGRLKNEFNKKFLEARNNKISLIKEQVVMNLKSTKLTKLLFLKSIEAMDEDENECTIFCKEEDYKNIKKHWNGEIKTMPENCIGGIIIAKNDGSIICDSSYKTRLEEFLRQNMKNLKNKIF